MKTCTACKEEKPVKEFSLDGRSKTPKLVSRCKRCSVYKAIEWQRRNPDKCREYARRKVIRLKGITPERYEEMLEAQGGLCAVCGGPPNGRGRLHIDHNHACCGGIQSCGRCVRSLVCLNCNVRLEIFENPEKRNMFESYLASHPLEKKGR